MIPAEPRFIACRASLADARIVLFGIPFEGRVNLRRGADHGPRELRLASDSIETYSPFLGRDLEDLAIADLGDCELGDGTPREQLARAREEIRRFWRPGLRSVMLGGDHTATLPVIEVLAPTIPDLRILQLDAHPDLREEFLGERVYLDLQVKLAPGWREDRGLLASLDRDVDLPLGGGPAAREDDEA